MSLHFREEFYFTPRRPQHDDQLTRLDHKRASSETAAGEGESGETESDVLRQQSFSRFTTAESKLERVKGRRRGKMAGIANGRAGKGRDFKA